ncbi:hypothetical protein BpHYR1_052332 [Brachionus plicatilis]|uniref:Uncharacterized protein n=1 Tax=Brachionus plicatilis TaxID=10195 RepID=A0A3M7T3Q1_BRAPC|nr:hypothetical protein BpHYR1_052332 [Brachionus plicatilis]
MSNFISLSLITYFATSHAQLETKSLLDDLRELISRYTFRVSSIRQKKNRIFALMRVREE